MLIIFCIFADAFRKFAGMENVVKYVLVEHLNRPGDVVECDSEIAERPAAKVYHFHSTLELVIVKKGWVDGLVGEISGRMGEGSLFVLGGNLPHKILGCSPDCRATLLHIPSELLAWDSERFPELSQGAEFIRRSRSGLVYESEELVRRIQYLTRKISGSEGFMRLSYLMQAIHILCNSAPDSTILADIPNPQRKKDAATPLERAQEYLYQHFTEELSLDEVAAAAGMEKTALCRAFKKTTGNTIMQCVIRMRIEQACHLLLTTSLTISQIAWQCGFGSFSQFSTHFRRQMGMSPGEYRINH